MQPRRPSKQLARTTRGNRGTNNTKNTSQSGHEEQQSHVHGDKKQGKPSGRHRIPKNTIGCTAHQLGRYSAVFVQQNLKRRKGLVNLEEYNNSKKGYLSKQKQEDV